MDAGKTIHILVVDGQGGKLGRQLIELIRKMALPADITAVGTNALATSNMMKAGADAAATGENAILVGCRTADIIVGPLGIVIADALHGEITPAMAVAVGQSRARKVLIPINKCNHLVVGVADYSMSLLIEAAVDAIKSIGS